LWHGSPDPWRPRPDRSHGSGDPCRDETSDRIAPSPRGASEGWPAAVSGTDGRVGSPAGEGAAFVGEGHAGQGGRRGAWGCGVPMEPGRARCAGVSRPVPGEDAGPHPFATGTPRRRERIGEMLIAVDWLAWAWASATVRAPAAKRAPRMLALFKRHASLRILLTYLVFVTAWLLYFRRPAAAHRDGARVAAARARGRGHRLRFGDLRDALSADARGVRPPPQIETALRKSEELFHALARLSPVGIFRSGPDGRCSYVNEAWTRITGIEAGRALGEGGCRACIPGTARR